jgi:hypothetical protein
MYVKYILIDAIVVTCARNLFKSWLLSCRPCGSSVVLHLATPAMHQAFNIRVAGAGAGSMQLACNPPSDPGEHVYRRLVRNPLVVLFLCPLLCGRD